MRTILATLMTLVAASSTLAQGPAPALKNVSAVDKEKGTIITEETAIRVVPVNKFVPKIQNGVTVFEAVTVNEYQTVSYQVMHSLANARVITPDGKQLPIDEVWKHVKANTVVAFSASSATPAEVYRRALNSNTLIIIPPQLQIPVPPPSPPPEAKK